MDKMTILGLLIGFGAIVLGNLFEGGHTASLIQGSAFLIVMGGTLGAVMVSHRGQTIKEALKLFGETFTEPKGQATQTLNNFRQYSRIAKKEGMVALEKAADSIKDPWEKDALRMVMDGVGDHHIREAFNVRIAGLERRLNQSAKVFSDAGGFAPTVGILGAVLGLIHVMGNLSDTSKLGAGIAVAFVATIYGVGFSNLFFIPIGNKIKNLASEKIKDREMLVEGAIALAQDVHPLVMELKLKSYTDEQ